MKVLHIFGELRPSGGEAMMLSAAPIWLSEAEMHILSMGETVGVYAEQLASAGYRIHHIPFSKTLGFFLKCGLLLRKEQFDVVHLHTERACLFFALVARIALGYSRALLRTVHHLFKFTRWLKGRKKLERFAMRSFLKVTLISNSPSGKRNELKRYGSDNLLIPNWYDSTLYCPPTDFQRRKYRHDLGYSENTCVFLSLGGNWPYKNYPIIVQALTLIPEEIDILYVQVGVQGEGAPLETLAVQLGVSRRIRCMGVVQDPIVFLHAADVFLMPSSEEGFGVAAVEAMACGLPTILSDVEALCDFRDRINGIEYINPTPHEISSAMLKLSKLAVSSRRILGNTIADATRNFYGLECGAFEYMQLYKRLTSKA